MIRYSLSNALDRQKLQNWRQHWISNNENCSATKALPWTPFFDGLRPLTASNDSVPGLRWGLDIGPSNSPSCFQNSGIVIVSDKMHLLAYISIYCKTRHSFIHSFIHLFIHSFIHYPCCRQSQRCSFHRSLYVYSHCISKTYAARITKRDIQIFYTESWKSVYFGAKRSKVNDMSLKSSTSVGLCPLVSAGFF